MENIIVPAKGNKTNSGNDFQLSFVSIKPITSPATQKNFLYKLLILAKIISVVLFNSTKMDDEKRLKRVLLFDVEDNIGYFSSMRNDEFRKQLLIENYLCLPSDNDVLSHFKICFNSFNDKLTGK